MTGNLKTYQNKSLKLIAESKSINFDDGQMYVARFFDALLSKTNNSRRNNIFTKIFANKNINGVKGFLSLVNPILDNIRKERGLTDFRVVLDDTPESIDRNELNGRIFIKPTRSLEYISIEFNITNTGASFDDI